MASSAVSTATTLATASTAAVATTGPASKFTGGDIRVGLDGEPPTLDPAGNSLSLANGSVYSAVFETLMTVPVGGTVQPMLLESMTEAPDRLSWTLVVRAGVTFQDGMPFDAAAVKFNLDRQQASPYNGPSINLITNTDVVDPKTVKVTLKQPWTGFPAALSTVVGVMASPASLSDSTKAARNPVGTGPFQFVEWVSGDHVTVKKYDKYWGAQGALVDSIIFKIVPDETARYTALKAGDLDAVATTTVTTSKQAAVDGYPVISAPPSGYGLLLLNTTKAPLDDVRVRQALNIGWDRDAIAKAFNGDDTAHAGFGPYPPTNKWYVAPTTVPSYDAAKAKALIKAYGKSVTIKLLITSGNQTTIDSLNSMAQNWNDEGMKVTVEQVPDLTTYVTTVISGNYQMAGWINGLSVDPDGSYFNQFHTGGSGNYEHYSNPALDALLDQGRTSTDEAQRMDLYGQAQQILRNDVPVIVTSHGKIDIIVGKRVTMDPDYFFPSRTVHLTGS